MQKAQIFLVDLEKSNPKVAEILDRFVVGDKKYIASNELTQPTFRIAKYELLTHDAAKLTNPDHADHQLLTQACDECIKTLTSVNETVDRIMRSNRLHEL